MSTRTATWRAALSGVALILITAGTAWGQAATPTPTTTPTFLPVRTPTPAQGAGNRWWSERGRCAEVITAADTWATVCTVPVLGYKTRQFAFTAVYNTLDVQILCSVDGGTTFPIVETASFAQTAATPLGKTSTGACTHLRVQVKPAVSVTHGTLQTSWLLVSY